MTPRLRPERSMTALKSDPRALAYWLDDYDQVVCVSESWPNFACANAAPGLTPDAVLHHPIGEFLADAETRQFYQILLERVRACGLAVQLPFRCDSPAVVRFMEIRLSLTSDGLIQLDTRLLEELIRAPVMLLDVAIARSDERVTLCSWCKKAEVAPGRWQEIEDAIMTLELFDVLPLPSLTYGVCADCRQMLDRELAHLSRRRTGAPLLQPA